MAVPAKPANVRAMVDISWLDRSTTNALIRTEWNVTGVPSTTRIYVELAEDLSFDPVVATIYGGADCAETVFRNTDYNTDYYVRAYAVNDLGESTAVSFASGYSNPTTSVPDVPTNVVAITGNGSDMDVSCTSPTSGASDYLWEYKLTTEPTIWTSWAGGNTVAETIIGLDGNTSYDFRVTARTAAGDGGEASATVTETTGAVTGTNPTSTDLLVYYKLDEASGNIVDAHDEISLGLTATGTIAYAEAGVDGTALGFNGTNASASGAGGAGTGTLAYPFSFSAWCKTTATASGNVLCLTTGSSTTVHYAIGVDASGMPYIRARNGTDSNVSDDVAINDGTWHHICGVWAASNDRKLYVDGELATSSAVSVNFNTSCERLGIGAYVDTSPSDWFNGTIDEVSVFTKELTLDEVLYLKLNPTYEDI